VSINRAALVEAFVNAKLEAGAPAKMAVRLHEV
jgi:hypothetical protein